MPCQASSCRVPVYNVYVLYVLASNAVVLSSGPSPPFDDSAGSAYILEAVERIEPVTDREPLVFIVVCEELRV